MEKNNLFVVLKQLIEENHFQCEWGMQWNEETHYLELIFQYDLDNPYGATYGDGGQISLSSQRLPYEIRVILYQEDQALIDQQRYIYHLPVSQDQGIAYGELVAIIKYLKIITAKIPQKWLAFRQDSQAQHFVTEWNQDHFMQIKQSLIDTHRYNEQRVYFPTEK
ncbi:DUF3013 family protein [Vaginisenegalia massiliensis]|uniref:DUF3013 family protein n=1 Tax=Vaginisenegalia massiliensis TaxID=2058294 RepID=UPI0013DE4058|nr:DUF3013 family protein [Vaginisenegalia massiliensis]